MGRFIALVKRKSQNEAGCVSRMILASQALSFERNGVG